MALGSTRPLTEISTRRTWRVNAAGAYGWQPTTFMCRLSRNRGASTSWNPLGLARPVMGLIFFFYLSLLVSPSFTRHIPSSTRGLFKYLHFQSYIDITANNKVSINGGHLSCVARWPVQTSAGASTVYKELSCSLHTQTQGQCLQPNHGPRILHSIQLTTHIIDTL
jgi:hypothetical protein